MRFAYINSQGKEVPIPSVEALQLRIELGAITSATMFYDASADKWAPADEHEIFRTLQKEVVEKQEGVYMAPPPPSFEASPRRAPVVDERRTSEAPVPDWDDPEEEAQEPSSQLAPPLPHDPFEGIGFELTPLPAGEVETDAPAPERPLREPDSFDFGDLTGLELDRGAMEPEPSSPPNLDFASTMVDESFGSRPIVDESFGSPPIVDESFGSAPPGWATELELEKPLSERLEEGPPAWLQEGQAESPTAASDARKARDRDTDGELESWSAAGVEPAARPAPTTPERTAPARPRVAPARPKRSVVPLVVTLFVVGLASGLGYFGLRFMRGRRTEEAPPAHTYAPVTIPEIPAQLEPTFRSVVGLAIADVVQRMGERHAQAALPPGPPGDWLSGRYLAGASGFPEVATYWSALTALLEDVRRGEEQVFSEALGVRLDSLALPAADRAAVQERALAGFRATLPQRDVVYDRLAAVLRTAAELHDFLLRNEESIDYEPAGSGISRDPVLEAVPLTKPLGDEMWGRIDRINAALEEMAALTDAGVSTERLFGITFDQIGAIPVQ